MDPLHSFIGPRESRPRTACHQLVCINAVFNVRLETLWADTLIPKSQVAFDLVE